MFRSLILRIVFRSTLVVVIISTFVAVYIRIQDNDDSETETTAGSGLTSTTRTARYISDDGTVHFEEVARFDAPDKSDDVRRSNIKIDGLGDVYVSLDGSDIAIADSGRLYSERAPAWTVASGESRLFYALPRDGRLVFRQSDGGRVFQTERLIADGFRSGRPPVQGNLTRFQSPTGSRFYNVFLSAARNELELARCVEPCRRFTTSQIWTSPTERTLDHPYPFASLDSAGGIHVVFSDGHDVFLTSSADDGETWTEPVRVNDRSGEGGKSAFAPVVTGGDSGHIAVVWQQGTHVLAAYASDAFSSDPSFHETLIADLASPEITASAATDPVGTLWVAYRSARQLIVTRQTAGAGLMNGALWSALGNLQCENNTRRLSVNVRQDLTGQFNFLDSGLHLSLRANRFKVSSRRDGGIAISGNGRLQNGTDVTFTLLVPEGASEAGEISISISNGYFASGNLVSLKSLAADLHIVAEGGSILKIPR